MSALVTVVVPIYNVEKYLERCLSSIVNQTYADLEILLIDDGSTDGCPQICDRFAAQDSRIRVIHKENAGLGMARNTGIDHATGEYICFFDSDDYVEPDTVAVCVAAAAEHGADMVVFGHDDVTADGEVCGRYLPHPPKALFVGEEITHALLPASMCASSGATGGWHIMLSACNKLYSLAMIRESGWRFVSEREIVSEDYYSLTELHGHLRRVYVLDRVLYHYTVNDTSLSRTFREDRFERICGFHAAMRTLIERMGLTDVLEQPLLGVTVGFAIGAMKQTVTAALPFRRRYGVVKQMISDTALQGWVRAMSTDGAGIQKKLLLTAIKHRWVCLCYLFLYIKSR